MINSKFYAKNISTMPLSYNMRKNAYIFALMPISLAFFHMPKPVIYICTAMIFIALFFLPVVTYADECWAVTNVKGYGAYANEKYKYIEDGLVNSVVVVCFTEKGGYVIGTETKFIKLGKSTLVGYAGSHKGNELVEVYQIDRENNKLLYTKSRVGTQFIDNPIAKILSNVVASYVGDVERIIQ